MTALYPEPLRQFIVEHSLDYNSRTAGLIAIVLLIALLVEKELLRAARAREGNRSDPWLNAATYPLLVVFVLVVGARFIQLL